MNWMRADIVFPERRAILVVSRTDTLQDEEIRSIMGCVQSTSSFDMPAIHDDFMVIIERARPELKGATIHYVGYEISTDEWHIGISHQSFQPIVFGLCAPLLALNPKVNFTYPPPAETPAPTVVT